MLTNETLAMLAIMAGPNHDWGGKYARPHSDVRTGLADFIYRYADGTCVFCESPVTREDFEVCHLISAGGTGQARRGFVPGNLASGCGRCNQKHAFMFTDIPMAEVKRPDLVPTVWPSTVELRHAGRLIKAARRAA